MTNFLTNNTFGVQDEHLFSFIRQTERLYESACSPPKTTYLTNSSLMTALQDEEGELYVQSPAYLYELMNKF